MERTICGMLPPDSNRRFTDEEIHAFDQDPSHVLLVDLLRGDALDELKKEHIIRCEYCSCRRAAIAKLFETYPGLHKILDQYLAGELDEREIVRLILSSVRSRVGQP
ncbi:MAG: hypothetical protein WCT32_05340 [Patescibacteria group bacterium]